MSTHILKISFASLPLMLSAVPAAQAQWAVIDAPAIVQLVQEVRTLEQQLATARDQLTQSEQALKTMTGNRGMAWLLAGISRNYLPTTWSQLTAAMQGTSAAYGGLAADIRAAMTANAVLSPQELSSLSALDQQQIVAARQVRALQQGLSQETLSNVSGRFASIQSLIAAISTAGDQKAILELQARIGAELGMLQNEQTKLLVLHQAAAAQISVDSLKERERIIAGHGRFENRFQPTP